MKQFFKNYFLVRKQDIFNNTDKNGIYHGGMNPIVEDVLGTVFAVGFWAFNFNILFNNSIDFKTILLFFTALLGAYNTVRFLPKLIVDSYLVKALKKSYKEK